VTGIWWKLLGYGLELVIAGLLLAALIGIVAGSGADYSCAPIESDDDPVADDREDAGHDRWVDQQNGVT